MASHDYGMIGLMVIIGLLGYLARRSVERTDQRIDNLYAELDRVKEKYVSRDVFKEDLKSTENHLKDVIQALGDNIKEQIALLKIR